MLQARPRSQGVLSLQPTPLPVGDDKPAPEAVARPPMGPDLAADEMNRCVSPRSEDGASEDR